MVLVSNLIALWILVVHGTFLQGNGGGIVLAARSGSGPIDPFAVPSMIPTLSPVDPTPSPSDGPVASPPTTAPQTSIPSVKPAMSTGIPTTSPETPCTIPSGVTIANTYQFPANGGAYLAAVENQLTHLSEYESPIQYEIVQSGIVALFNAAAAYHATSLDLFGRQPRVRFCDDGDASIRSLHRQLTLVYVTYFGALPEAQDQAEQTLVLLGIDPAICASQDCSDESTPWGLAATLVEEAKDWRGRNNWNADGKLGRRSANAPPTPFKDFREFPYTPRSGFKDWKPTRESNGHGLSFAFDHVVPHIGEAGRTVFLSDDEVCAASVSSPLYDYAGELANLTSRMSVLDDVKKVKAEFFDSTLTSLITLLVQYYTRKGVALDSFEFILANVMVSSMFYDASIVAWKEKIRHSRARPSTVMGQAPFDATKFTLRAGEEEVFGREFHSYLRTAPSAEYPSASSCVCWAFADLMETLTGSDTISLPDGGPLSYVQTANTSVIEPGTTPNEDVTLDYFSWSQLATDCAQSRLDAGIHFPAAVQAGQELCQALGGTIHDRVALLETGQNFEDRPSFDEPANPGYRGCATSIY